jgi:hypothetical protein
MSAPRSQPDPAAALREVVDDDTPREEALRYATAALEAGESFDAVISGLLNAGWPDEEAEMIVEQARKLTRDVRGVTTFQDVRREFQRHYRSTARWTVGFPALHAFLSLRRSLTMLFKRR